MGVIHSLNLRQPRTILAFGACAFSLQTTFPKNKSLCQRLCLLRTPRTTRPPVDLPVSPRRYRHLIDRTDTLTLAVPLGLSRYSLSAKGTCHQQAPTASLLQLGREQLPCREKRDGCFQWGGPGYEVLGPLLWPLASQGANRTWAVLVNLGITQI